MDTFSPYKTSKIKIGEALFFAKNVNWFIIVQ